MTGRRLFHWLLAAVLSVGILGIGAGFIWYQMFYMPYCIQADCRGKEIDVEMMKRWEEREKDGSKGIIRMAGWRIENWRVVSAVSTGRSQRTQIFCVYGSMELVDKASVLSGRYGLAVEEDYCILSESLARNLFGSVDVAGQFVKMGRTAMVVAGVIEKDGDILMMPATNGRMEQVAAEFKGRLGAKEKMEGLIEGDRQ